MSTRQAAAEPPRGAAVALVALPLALVLPATPEPFPTCPAPQLAVATPPGARWSELRCDGLGHGPPTGAIALLFGIPIDLNRAAAVDLEALPGIGPARARALVAARRAAPLCGTRDLSRVRGIGPHTAERLRGWVREARAPCGGPVEESR